MTETLNPSLTPKVLFEDPNLLVIDKPAGLLSQADHSGEPSVVTWAQGYLGRPYVGLIHRLDRNTSGTLVLAKRTKAAGRLTEAIQKHLLQKYYLALVHGVSPDDVTVLEDYLRKDEEKKIMRVVSKSSAGAQQAKLEFRSLKHAQVDGVPVSLVMIKLYTGRFHQIRAQFAHARLPLCGDIKYSKNSSPQITPRVALHAHKVAFPHPISKELITIESPWPQDLQAIVPFRNAAT